MDIFDVRWRKSVRRLWKLPWTARSHLLPALVNKPSFVNQLCIRFAKIAKSIEVGQNRVMQLLMNIILQEMGVIGRNINFVNTRWNCNLAKQMPKPPKHQDEEIEVRVQAVKELTNCLEHSYVLENENFQKKDIVDLLNFISTFR